jgi:AbrB family transcriptional regulator (stage V sporulation protein T)
VKSTGVLRRVDELGRIVIPKEIRKNLKIRDGESLEIFINGDAVVLKKYSYMSDLNDIAQACSDSFYDIINKNILITDRDCVIASSGSLKKKYNGKEISQSLSNIIDKRSVTLNNSNDGLEIISGIVEESKYIVSSVIVSGDAVGSVIILSDENINDTEEKCSNFIAKFLSKHLE